MKIQLNTNLVPIFSGTYETQWDVFEVEDNGDELEVEYDHQELMQSIAGEYQDHAKEIQDDLNSPFIKSLAFTGKFESPREYNFSTDTLDFDIEVNRAGLLRTLEGLKDNKDFQEFLHDHYTSYDGFMSFTPNNYNELVREIKTQGREFEQSIGALIRFLAKDNIEHEGGCSIEDSVHEDWQGNGYGGLNYKIV